jgi:hypothetical protein
MTKRRSANEKGNEEIRNRRAKEGEMGMRKRRGK